MKNDKLNKRCQYQFELWEDCNSKCKFCYLGNANNIVSDEIKINNLTSVINKISDLSLYKKISCLAYIGGEFFQGQLKNKTVKDLFMQLMMKTNDLLNNKYIDEVWISATLTIGNQLDLYECLKIFQGNINKIWILTSYDTIGRFHTEKMKQDWINNLSRLRHTYDDININITSILTGDFIDKYINETLDIKQIANQYKCSMFWKPTCSIDRQDDNHKTKIETNKIIPNFYPSRKQFLNFLYKYKTIEDNFLYDKLFNMEYRSDYLEKFTKGFTLSHRIKDKSVENTDTGCCTLKCGHSNQYNIYIDCDGCAICDKKMIKDMI